MSPQEFVTKLYPFAVNDKGFDPFIILTQAALESGWGKYAPGNMFFGVKDTDGVNGNEQLVRTTEVSKNANLTAKQAGLETIERVEPSTIAGQKYFVYHGLGYFRKYETPKESFDDHIKFFLSNGRYARACTMRNNPVAFFQEIANAGYATAPNYAQSLISTYNSIKQYKP